MTQGEEIYTDFLKAYNTPPFPNIKKAGDVYRSLNKKERRELTERKWAPASQTTARGITSWTDKLQEMFITVDKEAPSRPETAAERLADLERQVAELQKEYDAKRLRN